MQMTFESLREIRSDEPKLNPSAPKAPRLKRQAQVIYRSLKQRPLYTNDLRSIAAQYNSRIKELRVWLREFDMTIDMTKRSSDGNNRFELRPFNGSKYQAYLMAKQAKRRTYETS